MGHLRPASTSVVVHLFPCQPYCSVRVSTTYFRRTCRRPWTYIKWPASLGFHTIDSPFPHLSPTPDSTLSLDTFTRHVRSTRSLDTVARHVRSTRSYFSCTVNGIAAIMLYSIEEIRANPGLLLVPKKGREERAKEREEKAAADKLKKAEAAREKAAERKRKRHEEEAAEAAGPRRGLPPRPLKKPGEKMTYDEREAEALHTRYYGPRYGQSTFIPNKKRRRADVFQFGWDPKDDTTRADPEGEAALARVQYLTQPTPDVDLPRRFEGADEVVALKHADFLIQNRENGEQQAAEHMRKFYDGRAEAIAAHQKWNKKSLPWCQKELDDMTDRNWDAMKQKYNISMVGSNLPNPMREWSEGNLPPLVTNVLRELEFSEPTPIQRAAIPVGLHGRDILGRAQTGTGKTLAFVIPLVVSIANLPPITPENADDGPYALILAPTRELAQQIEGEARKFAEPFGFQVTCLVGGKSVEGQGLALQQCTHIIVATPGRLKDCLERRLVVLERCCFLVMDEADRMVDMGFEESVQYILSCMPITNEKPDGFGLANGQASDHFSHGLLPRYRQTMMFTATMPLPVERMAEKYLKGTAKITIGAVGEAVDTVQQITEQVGSEKKRIERLAAILSSPDTERPVMVFLNSKVKCEYIAKEVRKRGFSTAMMHGGKSQGEREEALERLRRGDAEVLFATDLLARGIDVPGIAMVINFDMARTIDLYTHRIGRTGRAGRNGVAITFWDSDDAEVLQELKVMISRSAVSKLADDLNRFTAQQPRKRR
jgi:ATP-dependent RNA helicase DDX23/PRP28